MTSNPQIDWEDYINNGWYKSRESQEETVNREAPRAGRTAYLQLTLPDRIEALKEKGERIKIDYRGRNEGIWTKFLREVGINKKTKGILLESLPLYGIRIDHIVGNDDALYVRRTRNHGDETKPNISTSVDEANLRDAFRFYGIEQAHGSESRGSPSFYDYGLMRDNNNLDRVLRQLEYDEKINPGKFKVYQRWLRGFGDTALEHDDIKSAYRAYKLGGILEDPAVKQKLKEKNVVY